MVEPTAYLTIGRIGAPYGIKGWVKLISYTDPADNILNYRHLLLDNNGKLEPVEIDASRAQGNTFVCHIKGCDDRDLTRRYTSQELLIAKSELPALEEGYYWHQLVDLRVVNKAGEELGLVDKLLETGANDVLVVKATESSIDDNERLLPYLPGQVILNIDLDQRLIKVDWEKEYLVDQVESDSNAD